MIFCRSSNITHSLLENLKKDMDLILGNLLNWRKERIDGEGLGFPLFLAKILMGRRLKSYKLMENVVVLKRN